MFLYHHTSKSSPHICRGHREPHSPLSVTDFTTDEVMNSPGTATFCLTGSLESWCPSLLWTITCTNTAVWERTVPHSPAFSTLLSKGTDKAQKHCHQIRYAQIEAYTGVPCRLVDQWEAEDWPPELGLAPKIQSSDRCTLGLGHLAGTDPCEPHSSLSHAVSDLCLMWSFFSAEPTLTLLYCFPPQFYADTSPPERTCSLCHRLMVTIRQNPSSALERPSWTARGNWESVLCVQQRIRSENVLSLLYHFLWSEQTFLSICSALPLQLLYNCKHWFSFATHLWLIQLLGSIKEQVG